MEQTAAILLEGNEYDIEFISPEGNWSPTWSNQRAVSFQRNSGHYFEEPWRPLMKFPDGARLRVVVGILSSG